jgi:hypothetical protein
MERGSAPKTTHPTVAPPQTRLQIPRNRRNPKNPRNLRNLRNPMNLS